MKPTLTVSPSPWRASLASSSSSSSPSCLFIAFTVDDEDFADLLHRLRAGALAERLERVFARLALEVGRAHLDELVRLERELHLLHHVVGEPFRADQHHRLEPVRPRLELLPFRRVQHE